MRASKGARGVSQELTSPTRRFTTSPASSTTRTSAAGYLHAE